MLRTAQDKSRLSAGRRSNEGCRSNETLRSQAVPTLKGEGPVEDSTRSKALGEGKGNSAQPNPTPKAAPSKPQRRTWVYDRFGRRVWLRYDPTEDVDEVHIDEDGNYYAFETRGLRVKLASGQIHDSSTSQPYCTSDGKKVNLSKLLGIHRSSEAHRPSSC